MGKKAKTSRKGKKAWRANISTEDIHDFFEKSTKDALSGGSLTAAPSDSLFFVDKSSDLSVKRKIEKHREKVLRVDSVLQKNPFVKAVPSSTLKDSKKKRKEVAKQSKAPQDSLKNKTASASSVVDLWDDEGQNNRKSILITNQSVIPAVEIEPSGCSFNPSFESHQDSLARAVAEEMQKIYRNELGPEPVPLTVPGEAVDEDEKYFLEVDDGMDDDTNVVETGDPELDKRPSKTKMVTRVEFNRRVRRKERLKKEGEAKKVERLSKEIDSIPDIVQEIAKEDEEKHNKHLRRTVAKEERSKSFPPRLGKHKFEPAPQQVLLSEEITGSLRKLKACCTLAKDRYKSLEKRGLIVPRGKKSRRK